MTGAEIVSLIGYGIVGVATAYVTMTLYTIKETITELNIIASMNQTTLNRLADLYLSDRMERGADNEDRE